MKSMVGCALLLIAAQAAILINNVKAHKGLACEGGELPLNCPPDTFINITMAMYGRQDNITCPHASASVNKSCSSDRSLSAVQALCNGRTYCDVEALSYYFGDPCNGTYKYLTLEYMCSSCVNKHGNDAECEMWALQGKCVGTNQTWMEANCSKACFKCESLIDPIRTNVLDDVNCTKRAAAGECKTNIAFMGAYCKKACLECPQTTSCENKANETDCNKWYNQAECSNNPTFMLGNCRATCFNCTSNIKCENRASMCDTWALQGACMANPGYMMAFCSKSCLGCTKDPICEDKYTDCDYWAKNNECVNSPVWMYKNCWKSCLKCTGPAVCANTLDDARCEALAAKGQCTTDYDFMMSNCRLACTRCKALDYGRAKCVNANLNDSLCTAWAQAGECTTNSGFMLTNCYKACTSCYKPYRIGNSAFPGQALEDTAALSVILPVAFTDNSVITQFSAYFANMNPVHLQVWRPNGSNVFIPVFDEMVNPTAANQTQAVVMKWCIVVKPGDRIGFTSFSDPAPIAYRMNPSAVYYPTYTRIAATNGSFSSINAPYEYSLSADFVYGSSCQ